MSVDRETRRKHEKAARRAWDALNKARRRVGVAAIAAREADEADEVDVARTLEVAGVCIVQRGASDVVKAAVEAAMAAVDVVAGARLEMGAAVEAAMVAAEVAWERARKAES